MSLATPTISNVPEYLILLGPKCWPIGFWSLKNFLANASLMTATFRVVAVSWSVKGRPISILAPIVSKKPGVTVANPAVVFSFGGGSGRPSTRMPSFQIASHRRIERGRHHAHAGNLPQTIVELPEQRFQLFRLVVSQTG